MEFTVQLAAGAQVVPSSTLARVKGGRNCLSTIGQLLAHLPSLILIRLSNVADQP